MAVLRPADKPAKPRWSCRYHHHGAFVLALLLVLGAGPAAPGRADEAGPAAARAPAAPARGPALTPGSGWRPGPAAAGGVRQSGGWLWRYCTSLLVVAGFLWAGLALLRRVRVRCLSQTMAQLQVCGRLALDARNSLAVVRTNGVEVLLAYGAWGVRPLCRWPVAAAAPAPMAEPRPAAEPQLLFGAETPLPGQSPGRSAPSANDPGLPAGCRDR